MMVNPNINDPNLDDGHRQQLLEEGLRILARLIARDILKKHSSSLGHTSFNITARYRKIAGEEHKAWYEKLWKSDT
jgi:hypothetical protein